MDIDGINRYLYKGIDREDIYQEAYLIYLEHKNITPQQIKSRIRTHLMRLLDKEYKYKSIHSMSINDLQDKSSYLFSPVDCVYKKLKDILQVLPLIDYVIVCLYWGLIGPTYETCSLEKVHRSTGKGIKYIRNRIEQGKKLIKKHYNYL